MTDVDALSCQLCNIEDFPTYAEFHLHHLGHIRSPVLSLLKLSDWTYNRICANGVYKLSSGIARKSTGPVSPLKISFRKEGSKNVFKVVSVEKKKEESSKLISKPRKRKTRAVEGNKLLERFGAGVSIQRRGGKAGTEPAIKQETTEEEKVDTTKDKEKLLQKLSGIDGISIGKKNGNGGTPSEESSGSGLSIASKSAKPFDLAEYNKILKEKKAAEEKEPVKDSGALLAKFSGISFTPKGAVKTETPPETEKTAEPEKPAEESESGEEGSESESEEEEKTKTDEPEKKVVTKGAVRVSNNLFSVKKEEVDEAKPVVEESNSVDIKENLGELSGIHILKNLTEKIPISSPVTVKSEAIPLPTDPVTLDSDGDDIIMEEIIKAPAKTIRSTATPSITNAVPSPTPSEQLHPDFVAPTEDSAVPAMNGQVFQAKPMTTDGVVPGMEAPSMVPYTEMHNNVQNNLQQTNVAYEGVDSTVNSLGAATTVDAGNYWTDVNAAQPGLEQPQQDPLMTGDGNVSQAFLQNYLGEPQGVQHAIPQDTSEYMSLERLGQGLEMQQQQQQQSQQGFQQAVPPSVAPMDQLTQQVQRMPGAPPQINVIPQHHMQAPGMQPQQPQQMQNQMLNEPTPPGTVSRDVGPVEPVFDLMHGGLTMQQLAAQQGNQQMMQPPMPNLYPAYNVYNQNFNQGQQQMQQQTQQQAQPQQVAPPQFTVPNAVARPPMLQPRPQITARPFQSMAAPRQRFAMKRSLRMSSPRHMTPPKQRRPDPNSPTARRAQGQNSSPGTRLPTGVILTPPKKTAENSKVANALASRGITMTSNRQQATTNQNRSPVRPAIPNLNLGPGVSITPSSGNRASGGFAVPANRRTVVNHNIERPAPCATVDLTMDDEPPQRSNRIGLGRFPCSQCPKVFTSSIALDTHKGTHNRNLPFKCEKCNAAYPTSATLNHHRTTYHKLPPKPPPDLAIPVVDLNQAGVQSQLQRAGITNFIPLSQLQSNSSGFYGLPVLNIDGNHDKAVSNMNTLGAANILVLGKLKPLPNR